MSNKINLQISYFEMVDIYRELTMIVTKTPSLRTRGHTKKGLIQPYNVRR